MTFRYFETRMNIVVVFITIGLAVFFPATVVLAFSGLLPTA
jgi:hypothetical protein